MIPRYMIKRGESPTPQRKRGGLLLKKKALLGWEDSKCAGEQGKGKSTTIGLAIKGGRWRPRGKVCREGIRTKNWSPKANPKKSLVAEGKKKRRERLVDPKEKKPGMGRKLCAGTGRRRTFRGKESRRGKELTMHDRENDRCHSSWEEGSPTATEDGANGGGKKKHRLTREG